MSPRVNPKHLTVFLLLIFCFWQTGNQVTSAAGGASRGIHVQARNESGEIRDVKLYSGYRALVIGCSDYRNGWPKLPNPVKDSKEVGEALKKVGFQVESLENPDSSALRRALSSLAGNADREQAIVVYFAGHGHTLTRADGNKLGYIVPVDAPAPETDLAGFMARAMSMREVEEIGSIIPAKHVLMAFDSCFSGSMFRSIPAPPSAFILDKVAEPVRAFITAGNENEQVPDQSVFKSVFLQGIVNGYADRNRDSYVTGQELGMYLQEEVVNYSEGAQHPQFGKIRNPLLDKGDFVFVAGGSIVTDKEALDKAQAKAETGSVRVETVPAGARVYIDGTDRGTSPLTLSGMKAGKIVVRAEKAGYQPREETVLVRDDRKTELKIVLDKIVTTGSIRIESGPSGAKWYLDEAFVGTTPDTLADVALGSHRLTVKKDGYEDWTQQIEVAPGKQADAQARLVEIPRPAAVAPPAEKSSPPPGGTYKDSATGIEMVSVKGGCYQMGDTFGDGEGDEKPVHEVCVDDFQIGKYEVTQGQWQAVMGNNPSKFKNGDNYPVERVSWDDAQEFIKKLNAKTGKNFRLPTEAEWEYAARSGGKKEKYAGGDDVDRFAWYGKNSGSSTHPVGTKQPNGLGIYDMSGNVWEWCQDWLDEQYYASSSRNNPAGPSSGAIRVIRGGSWSGEPGGVRAASRIGFSPGNRIVNLGFRLVLPVQ